MWSRRWWEEHIENAWQQRSVVWLSGVRRAGKTVLCQLLDGVEYFDCELPSVRRRLEDPESFLAGLRGKRVALDEIQRLQNPSEILKIAADHYPDCHVIATGSSTLQASAKFRDSLTGRKADIRLTPMILPDLGDFHQPDPVHRLEAGGLPPFFLAEDPHGRDFEGWLDSYWARDIQELFRLERRWSFGRLFELLLIQSGGMFEASRFAAPCEISRATVANYLDVLEATGVVSIIRPHAERGASEIVSAPKVYGFDTGFICHYRGWRSLRQEDLGALWEHFVLNELQARLQRSSVRYWRDKRGHEVDFVIPWRTGAATAIECKWSAAAMDPKGLSAFRWRYPDGENWLVAADIHEPYERKFGDLRVGMMGARAMAERLERAAEEWR